MDLNDIDSRARAALTEAAEHMPEPVCFNPLHTHQFDPCSERCPDHLHSCSKGCGEFPCKVYSIGEQAVTQLTVFGALAASLSSIVETLEEALEDKS